MVYLSKHSNWEVNLLRSITALNYKCFVPKGYANGLTAQVR